MNPHTPSRGYIALISVLIISTALALIAFSTGQSAYAARLTQTYTENHAAAYAHASACIQEALLFSAEDTEFSGKTSTNIHIDNNGACSIEKVLHEGTQIRITTKGYSYRSVVTLEAILTTNTNGGLPFNDIHWREL